MEDYACHVCGHRFAAPTREACPLCLSQPLAGGAAVVPSQGEQGLVQRQRSGNSACDSPLTSQQVPAPSQEAYLEGTVIRIDGPSQAEGRRDWWRVCCTLLLAIALFPLFAGVWALLTAWRLVLGIVGIRLGGGRGLLGDIVAFHLLGNAFRRPEPISVYHHVIDTGAGLVSARQEGEFQDGRIIEGHRVRLHGRRRGGTLVIKGGFNETLGTRLSFPVSPWRLALVLLLLLTTAEFLICAVLSSTSPVVR